MSQPFTLDKRTTIKLRAAAAVAAKLLQSCPSLCNPIDGSPPGSPIPGRPQRPVYASEQVEDNGGLYVLEWPSFGRKCRSEERRVGKEC